MDPVQIGAFIAARRKAQNMTQEALGERLGVTNKTISRWETGTYLPDIGRLQKLSDLLGVSVNELLAGEKLEDPEQFVQKADENLIQALAQSSAFGWKERSAFFRQKWRREHKAYLALWMGGWICACAVAVALRQPILVGAVCLAGVFLYGHVHNQMMIYVEAKAFDGKEQGNGTGSHGSNAREPAGE